MLLGAVALTVIGAEPARADFYTLVFGADYEGTGGSMVIGAELNGTGSPSDRMIFTANVSGTTFVSVINVGGTGAGTGTDNTDGISIIQVAGTSTASAFQLAGFYVAVGPYQYRLNAFDPSSSAASEADPLLGSPIGFWDYRLQSPLDANGDPVPVPQVPGYQALPSGALQYGWTLLESMHKRLGEIRELPAGQGDRRNANVFLHWSGEDADFDGDRGPDYDQTTWFVQAGGNVVGWDVDAAGSTLRGGLAVSYGRSDISIDSSGADVSLDGLSLALTGTYRTAVGWYVDAMAMGTRYDVAVTTGERGETGDPDGWGFGVSLEGGYPFELGDRFVIEPQVQVAFQRVWFDTFTDVDNIAVDLRDGDSLRARIGAQLRRTFASAEQALWSPYLQLDVIDEFLDGNSIDAAGVRFASDTGGTSVRLTGGVDAQLGPGATLFANVGYEAGLVDGSADIFSGTAGLRFSF